MAAFGDAVRDAGDGVFRAGQAQIDQLEPVSGGLPVADADRVGAGGQGGLQHEVRPLGRQFVEPLQHPPPGRQIARPARARQAARHVVRIDEPERLRALAQEAVDEGGLPSSVRTGEEGGTV